MNSSVQTTLLAILLLWAMTVGAEVRPWLLDGISGGIKNWILAGFGTGDLADLPEPESSSPATTNVIFLME